MLKLKLKTIFIYSLGISFLAFFHSDLFSQSLSFKNYTVNDGLPSSTVYSAIQDSHGYIWFATNMGVSQYDGYTFKNYTTSDGLSDNEIYNVFEDSHGRIWFLTSNGKVSYYYEGKIYNSKTDKSLLPANSESYLSGMTEDTVNHIIWISTRKNGLVGYFSDKSVKRFYSHLSFSNVFSAKNSALHLVERRGILKVKFDKSFSKVKSKRIHYGDSLFYFKSIQLTNENIIYTSSFSVRYLNCRTGALKEIWNNRLTTINNVCKEDSFVWICIKNGIIHYSTRTGLLSKPILNEYDVSFVLKDSEGNRWITTLSNGVLFCPSNAVYRYSEKDGLLTNKVSCLAKDKASRIWIGYEKGGVSVVNKGKIQSKIIANKKKYDDFRVRAISFSNENCWVTTNYGVILLNDMTGLFNFYGRDAVESPKDHLWITCNIGVLYLDKSFLKKYKVKIGKFINQSIIDTRPYYDNSFIKENAKKLFLDNKSNIWISTENKLYLVGEDLQIHNISKQLKKYTYVKDFAEASNGLILLATNIEGIIVLRNKRRIASITKAIGLSTDNCSALDIDNDGTIWVATNYGLDKIEGFPSKVRISHYNRNDGLLSNEVRDVLVVNDTVWVATNEGVAFFNKRNMHMNRKAPLMHIDRISVNGKHVRANKLDPVILKYYENEIRIYFSGISYKSNGEILYRYKLHNESLWKYTKNRAVELPELPPGEYRFVVESSGRYGEWSKEASFSFKIKKPFWATTIFIIMALCLLTGLVWMLTARYFQYRRNKILMKYQLVSSELKALRAQINPHFLFNAMNSIHAVLQKKDWESAQDYLHKFGDLMRSILEHGDRIEITIAEEINSLKNYLALEVLRMDHKFDYNIEVDSNIDAHNTDIPAMIIQPFVENAILHGLRYRKEGGHIIISFSLDESDTILINISDNGIGREKSGELNGKRKHKSKGMKLITDRLDMLNMQRKNKITINIEDLKDYKSDNPGTIVIIKIPYE